ncbi:MAG TPA: outer membrane protein assembly factor BamD [Pseudomonadales bacterium]|jgi:outer membrane protein assembly factor BamD
MLFRRVTLMILTLSLLSIMACSGKDEIDDSIPESELYGTARKQIDDGNFSQATRNLEALESRYPFGRYAEQAQLELIYAYYKSSDNELAIIAADRFIRLHPQHPQADYAYYMRGLAKYTQNQGLIERYLPFDATERDPGPARDSFADFALLLQKYPHSEYAGDARLRMIYLRNVLARYEVNVANYYLSRKAWLAAANRARGVVENFPQTPAVPDALAIMTQTYLIMGLNNLASESLAVLSTNYPQYPSLDAQGNFIPQITEDSQERSWVERISFGLFDRPDPPEFDHRNDSWLPPYSTPPASATPR